MHCRTDAENLFESERGRGEGGCSVERSDDVQQKVETNYLSL